MDKTQFTLVHGYMAAPENHWFPWLKTKLADLGHNLSVLKMPNANRPIPDEWQECLRKNIGMPSKKSVLIGHSLGCVSLLRYLESLPDHTQVGAVVCVAGFGDNLLNIPELNSFTNQKLNYPKLKKMTQERHVFVSENDMIVRPHHTEKLAQDFDAKLVRLAKYGHFLGDEGVKEFPEILDLLHRLHKV